jgi:hypothetical protein
MTMQGGRPTRFYSKKQEKIVAKAVSGKPVANSGATTFNKGDVTTEKVLIECKTCTKPQSSFSVKKEWIEKNREEAFAMGKSYSAVAIDFGDGEQHYIISQKMFNEWLKGIDNHSV